MESEAPLGSPRWTLGRYELLGDHDGWRPGLVRRAYDPELDREIALRTFSVPGQLSREPDHLATILADLRAACRLSHRAILAVYDAGLIGNEVYVAMEYVEGLSLRDWLDSDTRRPIRRVLNVFDEIARALVAAHSQGTYHGCLRPDHILVGDDGHARVAGFGLWRLEQIGSQRHAVLPRHIPPWIAGGSPVIRRNPAATSVYYLAPEQLDGAPADDRSDVYTFCVALWEALTQELPFEANDIGELRDLQREGPPWFDDDEIPHRVIATLRQGLAADPNHRLRSIQAVMSALDRDPIPRSGASRVLGASAAAACLSVIGWLAVGYDGAQAACDDIATEPIWEPSKSALASAFAQAPAPYAEAAWRRVEAELEAYARATANAQAGICRQEATDRAQPQIRQRLDCLQDRSRHLEAMLTVLRDADTPTVQHSVQAVYALPPIDVCSEPDGFAALAPVAPDARAPIEALRKRLALARALAWTGHHGQSVEIARDVAARATEIGHEPLIAEATLAQGLGLIEIGDEQVASELLNRAHVRAVGQRLRNVEFEASLALAALATERSGSIEDAQHWLARAKTTLERLPDPREASLQLALRQAQLEALQGSRTSGEAYRRAIALTERLGPRANVSLAKAISGLAASLQSQGETVAARGHHERAVAAWEHALGPQHPAVATALEALGDATLNLRDHRGAMEHFTRALEIRQASAPEDDAALTPCLERLARAHEGVGEYQEALNYRRRLLALGKQVRGPLDPTVGHQLAAIGNDLTAALQHEDAVEHHRQAVNLLSEAYGAQDSRLVAPLLDLAESLAHTEQHSEAEQAVQRAMTIAGRELPQSHPVHKTIRTHLAQLSVLRASATDPTE